MLNYAIQVCLLELAVVFEGNWTEMGINIGLDIGAISLKLAALGKPADRPTLEALCAAHPGVPPDRARRPAAGALRLPAHRGQPDPIHLRPAARILRRRPRRPRRRHARDRVSGSRTIAKVLGLFFENEFKAIARMIGDLLPAGADRLRIGGESSKYIRLEDGGIQDYDRSGECAAGTGSSSTSRRCACSTRWKRWATWSAAPGARRASPAAARVFAKSDMIHAQQKGYSPAEILRGLCDAVARNFKSSIVKGRPVEAAGGADRRGVAECRA